MKLVIIAIILSLFTLPTPVFAQSAWGPECVYDGDVITFQGLECLVGNILAVAITLISFGVLVMFVFGGYQILASGGDSKKVAGGKSTLTYAILGLVLGLSAWFILNIIATVTGAESIKFFSTQVSGS